MNKKIVLILTSLLVAFSHSATVQAQSFYPVALEYVAPDNIVAGAQVTTTLRLLIKADMKSLQVSANADTGLSVLSGDDNSEFFDLKSGDIRELDVTFQLEGGAGFLVVSTTATDLMGREKSKVRAIRYTAQSANTATISSAKLPGGVGGSESATGERLFLMPLEAR